MNISHIFKMMTRTVGNKLLNRRLTKDIHKATSDASGRQSPKQANREKQTREAVKRARQAAQITRRFK